MKLKLKLKQTMAATLAATMLFGAAPLSGKIEIPDFSLKASAVSVSNLQYRINGGEVTITGCSQSAAGELVIPSEIEGYPVTGINNYAFELNENLTGITIPESVTHISEYAFFGMTGKEFLKVDKDNKVYDSRDNCNAIIESDTNTLIAGCNNTVIPDTVTGIGESAFLNCEGLKEITIPDGIDSIGPWVFASCTGLKEITIPDSVAVIDKCAFYHCTALEKADFPNNHVCIKDSAFEDCKSLKKVMIPDGEVYCYDGGSFAGCTSLEEFEINGNIYVSGCMFSDCTNLKKVVINGTTCRFGNYMFSGCSNLEELTVTGDLCIYETGVFTGCTSLSLNTKLFSDSFDRNNITGQPHEDIYEVYSYSASGVCNIIYDDSNANDLEKFRELCGARTVNGYVDGNGLVYLDDTMTELTACPSCKKGDIAIPASVTEIAGSAFEGCTGITDVYYDGTEEEWNSVSIGIEGNNALLNATIHFKGEKYGKNKTWSFDKATGTLTILNDDGLENWAEYCNADADSDALLLPTLFKASSAVRVLNIGENVGYSFIESYECSSAYGNLFKNLEAITVSNNNSYFVFDKALYYGNDCISGFVAYPIASQDRDIYLPENCNGILNKACFSPNILPQIDEDTYTEFNIPGEFNLYITGEGQADDFNWNSDDWYFLPNIYVNASQEKIDEEAWNYGANFVVGQAVYNYVVNYYADGLSVLTSIESELMTEYEAALEEGTVNLTDEQWFNLAWKEILSRIEEMGYLDENEINMDWFTSKFPDSTDQLTEIFGSFEAGYEYYKKMVEFYQNTAMYAKDHFNPIKLLNSTVTVNLDAESDINLNGSAHFTASSAMPEAEFKWYVNGSEAGTGNSFTISSLTEPEYKVKVKAIFSNGFTAESEETTVRPDIPVSPNHRDDKANTFISLIKKIVDIIRSILDFIKLAK